MNYRKHYDNLIYKALNRVKPLEYCEKHHIFPKCLGGDNSKSNLVHLTYREHFVAHMLLNKLYPNHVGLAIAISRMIGNFRNSGKSYSALKRKLSKFYSEFHSEHQKIHWKDPAYRKIKADQMRQQWGNEDFKKMMRTKNSGESNPMFGKSMTELAKLKQLKNSRTFRAWKAIMIRPSSPKLGLGEFIKGELIGDFKNQSEFAKNYNVRRLGIIKCLKLKSPQCGGFIFEYID